MKAKFVAAKLFELAKRLVKFDKSFAIYNNGVDNNYPERVERIINNSATAKPAAKLFRKFIVGKGLGVNLDKFIVNKAKGNLSLRKFLIKLANSYAYQNGVFIHVNYRFDFDTKDFKISSLDVLPYNHCRVGKKDDKDWNGKILLYDNWDETDGRIDKNKIEAIDVFNPKKSVIRSQISNCKGNDFLEKIKNYKGQVFFYNPEETIYPLAHIDNVLNDADSEYRAGMFKNLSLRKGFFGKKIFITPPMVDGELRKPADELSDEELAEKKIAEGERDKFRKEMQSFIGADNVDGIMHLEMEFEGDDIEKVLKTIDIDTNINDKLFAYTESSTANNIRKAYANVPSILIENSDNSIFGNSGELLKSAKEFYQEQTEEDRENIETEILNPLFDLFEGFPMPSEGLKLIPLITVKKDVTNN